LLFCTIFLYSASTRSTSSCLTISVVVFPQIFFYGIFPSRKFFAILELFFRAILPAHSNCLSLIHFAFCYCGIHVKYMHRWRVSVAVTVIMITDLGSGRYLKLICNSKCISEVRVYVCTGTYLFIYSLFVLSGLRNADSQIVSA
jgi:hypothetical protein